MARVHTAYICDICGAGLVSLPGQDNDWETFNSGVLSYLSGKEYTDDEFIDLETCGKCSAKIRNAIVSLQRDYAVNAS